jgi:hypothetical protein
LTGGSACPTNAPCEWDRRFRLSTLSAAFFGPGSNDHAATLRPTCLSIVLDDFCCVRINP